MVGYVGCLCVYGSHGVQCILARYRRSQRLSEIQVEVCIVTYIMCCLSMGAVSLDDLNLWCLTTFLLVIAMNFHCSLCGNGTTMKLSHIIPCHLRWQGIAEPRPATGVGLLGTMGHFPDAPGLPDATCNPEGLALLVGGC